MCSLVYDPKFDVRPSTLLFLRRAESVSNASGDPPAASGVPSGSARVDRAGHASARASRSAARMSASSASPGEALTPRAREAWTGKDDARGERKDATPRTDVRAGFLAKYSRWSHDRPCLVFTSVFMAIIAISAVVALANLAEFNTDAGDKVRRLLSRCPKKRHGGRNNLPTRLRPSTVRHSALFPPTPRFRFRFRFRLSTPCRSPSFGSPSRRPRTDTNAHISGVGHPGRPRHRDRGRGGDRAEHRRAHRGRLRRGRRVGTEQTKRRRDVGVPLRERLRGLCV